MFEQVHEADFGRFLGGSAARRVRQQSSPCPRSQRKPGAAAYGGAKFRCGSVEPISRRVVLKAWYSAEPGGGMDNLFADFLSTYLLEVSVLGGLLAVFAYAVYVARTQHYRMRNQARVDRRKLPRDGRERRVRSQ